MLHLQVGGHLRQFLGFGRSSLCSGRRATVLRAQPQELSSFDPVQLQHTTPHLREAAVAFRAWEAGGKVGIPEITGNVHSTESLSGVDGPGIRYVIFLQGCAMRCQFCSNPDTWAFQGAGTVTTSKEVAQKLQRVASYLRPHNGGITLSGGEPMLQPHFAAAVFMEAHALGLTTCIDTNGQGTKAHYWDIVLPHTDSVLFCIKHMDPNKYEALTGMHQAPALHFAEELKARRIPWYCRYVYIPSLTDAPEDIEALIHWAKEQPTMQAIELLPYHLLGRNKWDTMKLKYPLEGIPTPTREAVAGAIEKITSAGLHVICNY